MGTNELEMALKEWGDEEDSKPPSIESAGLGRSTRSWALWLSVVELS
jgi:hypothetical protein